MITIQLINPPGFSDLAEQVAKLVPVKPGDLGDSVDVSDRVSFRADDDLVCYLTRRPGLMVSKRHSRHPLTTRIAYQSAFQQW